MNEGNMENSDLNQLKRGILKMIVLKILSEGKTYGYEMLGRIDRESNGLLHMKEGTLYPILYRLEDDGYIVSRWKELEQRAKSKKYYMITGKGRKKLEELVSGWYNMVSVVDVFLK